MQEDYCNVCTKLWVPSRSSRPLTAFTEQSFSHLILLEVLLVVSKGEFVQYGKELSPCF